MKLKDDWVTQLRWLCLLFVSCVFSTSYAETNNAKTTYQEQQSVDPVLEVVDELAQSASIATATLTIAVSNFKNERGKLFVSVYAEQKDWLGENTVMVQDLVVSEAIVDGSIELELELPIGEYAISLYHDENNNNKLDANFIGIPKEPAVVSNNAPARFGPPKYKAAKFLLGTEGARQDLEF